MMRSFTADLCVKLGSTSDDTIYFTDGEGLYDYDRTAHSFRLKLQLYSNVWSSFLPLFHIVPIYRLFLLRYNIHLHAPKAFDKEMHLLIVIASIFFRKFPSNL